MLERLLAYQSETVDTGKVYMDMNVDLGKHQSLVQIKQVH